MAIITLTRGVQSGGRELAHLLAERLGYSCLSREVISMCARKYNIMEKDLYDKLIEAPSRWRKLSRDHYRYLMYIQCSLIDAAKQDNVVYHGYAGQLFLRGVNHALKVRLEAPLEDRIEAERAEYNKTYDQAAEYIRAADESRNRWVKFLYNEDWHNPALYDLSINLKIISIDCACDLITLLIEKGQFETTKQSIHRLNNISLECEVKAAIASDDALWDQPITVQVEEESTIILRGKVKNKKVRKAIMDVAKQVKGVSACKDEMYLASEALSDSTVVTGHD
jgi:cytidylate kinase